MKIISTVGTSIYTNIYKREVRKLFAKNELEHIFNAFEELEDQDLPSKDYKLIDFGNLEENTTRFWLSGILKENNNWKLRPNSYNSNASAEIKSIKEIIGETSYNSVKLYLLTTDTAISFSAAHLIKKYFSEIEKCIKSENIYVEPIEGINLKDADAFQTAGFEKLIGAIDKIYNKKETTILNISGGYKALIPFLTIYAQLKGLPINYIYEESNKLIDIQALPLSFKYEDILTQAIFLKKEYLVVINKNLKLLNNLILENTLRINQDKISYTGKPELIVNNSQFINSTDELIEKRNSLNEIYKLTRKLKNNKLIDDENNNRNYYITPVGILFKNYANDKISGEFGHIIENKIVEKINNEINFKKQFNVSNIIEIIPSYKKVEGKFHLKNGEFQLGSTADKSTKNIDIGDIDIWLKTENTTKIFEIKAYKETLGFNDNINSDTDYFYKIKARVLQTKEFLKKQGDNKKIEYIFLVYKILFDELNDDFIKNLDDIKNYFTTKFKNDSELTNFTFKFKVITLSTSLSEFNYNKFKEIQNVTFDFCNQ